MLLQARNNQLESINNFLSNVAAEPVRFVVNDRGLFTVGWFGVREKYYSNL